MNDDTLLSDLAERLIADHVTSDLIASSEEGDWPAALWSTLEEHGLTLAAVPENLGGSGAELGDAFDVLFCAGSHAVPLPLAETMLAGWLLATANCVVPPGPLTVFGASATDALVLAPSADGWRLSGCAERVAWGRHAAVAVGLVKHENKTYVVQLARQQFNVEPGENLAAEPRDTLTFDSVVLTERAVTLATDGIDLQALEIMGATARTCQMAGALDRILDHSVRYVGERQQFGRPLAKFQAIQQHVALLAGEVACASVAADAAAHAVQELGPHGALLEVACAKMRVGEAASTGADIAHQVHGAMGFTQEYPLHHATRRLWSWRDEFGNEAVWGDRLVQLALKTGGDALWPTLTRHAVINDRAET